MYSMGIRTTSEAQMSKLGELDLSTWRGGVDDEDKDSSVDISLSPKSPLPVPASASNNPINGKLGVPLPQIQTTSTGRRKSANFTWDSDAHSASGTSECGDNDSENGVPVPDQLQLSGSHYQEQQLDNFTDLGVEGQTLTKEQIGKGGVKKVEFLEDPNIQRMGPDERLSLSRDKSRLTESSGKGNHSKRSTRSPSGSLLNEIRKMSLASQDAEDERRKLGGGTQATNTKRGSRRFRKRKREEEYTDKDRAAAVTLGSRDIKQSLKAKKKRERKMRLSIDFMSTEEYLSSMLVIEALYQLRVRKTPTAALVTLNKALELQPTHKGALVARSQCHLKLGDANSALKDAETSFGQNETFIQGLYQYAEALYQLGEFEKSLIAFHQGYRLRKDMEGFRIGVQKSQEAIRRAIGNRSATKMGNLDEILSIIEELQESKRKAVSTFTEEDLLMKILAKRFGEKATSLPELKAKCKSKNQWITREVLGQMYLDKEYLSKFIHRPDVKQQMGNAEALRETAKDGLNYLESREKFWRQQNPLYSRKTMANMIDNKSLLTKLSRSTSSENFKILQLKSRQSKEGQTSFTSTPRSALEIKPLTPNAVGKVNGKSGNILLISPKNGNPQS